MPAGNKDVFPCLGVGEGMLNLELPLLLAGGGAVAKEGATWESFKFKMFLRQVSHRG